MTADWSAALREPLSEEAPCGRSLEETGELALLESYQIFGLPIGQNFDPPDQSDGQPVPKREPRKSDRPPNWQELEELAGECLRKSKDIRVLLYFSAAVLRTRNLSAFLETVAVTSHWLETWWNELYPRVDEDAIFRANALSSFADHMAIIDGVRRAPLVSGPLGRISLRDLDGTQPVPKPGEKPPPNDATIRAAFAAMPIEDLRALHASILQTVATLGGIVGTMHAKTNGDAVPMFEALTAQLQAMAELVKKRVSEHPEASAADAATQSEAGDGTGAMRVGAIASRQDAIRALDAVAEFFRRSEPSSPVPLVVDRAKRLVSKNFLEVLADIAPTGLPEAKMVGGVRDEATE